MLLTWSSWPLMITAIPPRFTGMSFFLYRFRFTIPFLPSFFFLFPTRTSHRFIHVDCGGQMRSHLFKCNTVNLLACQGKSGASRRGPENSLHQGVDIEKDLTWSVPHPQYEWVVDEKSSFHPAIAGIMDRNMNDIDGDRIDGGGHDPQTTAYAVVGVVRDANYFDYRSLSLCYRSHGYQGLSNASSFSFYCCFLQLSISLPFLLSLHSVHCLFPPMSKQKTEHLDLLEILKSFLFLFF